MRFAASHSNYGLLELFLVSATSSVLPIPTEPTIALLLSDKVSPLIILIVLIPASVLGASVGYLLGKYWIRRIIPFHNPEREERIQEWFGKYGAGLLMFSPWIPFAGDLVPIVAGVEDFNRSTFLVIMFVAKAIKGAVNRVFPLVFCPACRLASLISRNGLSCSNEGQTGGRERTANAIEKMSDVA